MDVRSRVTAGVVALTIALAALTLMAVPASAEVEDPSSTSSTVADGSTPTSEGAPPSTASPSSTAAPSTTAPEPAATEPPATDAPASEPPAEETTTTTTGDEPGPDDPETTTTTTGDDTTSSTDPLIHEEEGEEAPETDDTVPDPGGAYTGQGAYQPAEVLWSSVRAAEAKVADASWTHRLTIEAARAVRLRQKELRLGQESLDDDAKRSAEEFREAETALRDRSIAAFMSNDALANALVGSLDAADHDRALELQARRTLLDAALDQDEEAIAAYLELRSELDGELLANLDDVRFVEDALRAAIAEVAVSAESVEQAENELLAFRAGSELYIDGVVFPVGGGYGLPLIDSYGFPRMPGTPDEHWHEGIDIFAPSGTPLLAAERSVVTRIGSGRLGGLTVWLRGESGTDWYYAHLLSHAPDLVEGAVIEPGHVIGYVGNTGNAISTPAHLHLQMHPGGGDPVNPYPLLKVISDRDVANR